ncbi:Homoserine kinase [Acaryochloris thomasi RCC1774]|uniref:Homoserine kinase n=1 Tax=Acaryochloris thomasi RCC1774 TaxID=1764569 RepID=A0A2W1JEF1_9CYAN|nr:homoserine kinase [Acaryochloris thomasi]PZD72066.1 Homoserine kinase [Acaryochloris thomasi RCC1774]
MSNPTFDVKVPATSANIGPGFDCLGAALTRYNRFQFTALDPAVGPLQIQVQGAEAQQVATDASNLVYKAFVAYFRDRPVPPVQIKIRLGVPLARGLGSSATAIVAGLMGANALAGSPLTRQQLLPQAIALEGHPDNVAPALLGNCQLAAKDQQTEQWTLCDVPWSPEVVPIVAIPDFELPTCSARQVLPKSCEYSTAIFNAAHLGLLIRGLGAGHADWLRAALQDRLHQPYRQGLIPGYGAVAHAAAEAGAYGMVISGAGPTLLALGPVVRGDAIATAMKSAWASELSAETAVLQIDDQGATAEAVGS